MLRTKVVDAVVEMINTGETFLVFITHEGKSYNFSIKDKHLELDEKAAHILNELSQNVITEWKITEENKFLPYNIIHVTA